MLLGKGLKFPNVRAWRILGVLFIRIASLITGGCVKIRKGRAAWIGFAWRCADVREGRIWVVLIKKGPVCLLSDMKIIF